MEEQKLTMEDFRPDSDGEHFRATYLGMDITVYSKKLTPETVERAERIVRAFPSRLLALLDYCMTMGLFEGLIASKFSRVEIIKFLKKSVVYLSDNGDSLDLDGFTESGDNYLADAIISVYFTGILEEFTEFSFDH